MPQLATFGPKVPVTIITGFLGSGKSTLVNHILQSTAGVKTVGIIENEFGEISIDKTLVGDNLACKEDLVSMEGGCVCCSLRKDIVKAFSELQTRCTARSRPMDHILLETTGLADPSPVAFTFFANAWIASRFQLDSITCLVDAKYLLQHLKDAQHGPQGAKTINEAVQQLAFSDLILVNKIDLVTNAEKAIVIDAIRRINNTARIIECQLNSEAGRPRIDEILGTNTFSVQRALQADPQFLDSDTDTDTEDYTPYSNQSRDVHSEPSTELQPSLPADTGAASAAATTTGGPQEAEAAGSAAAVQGEQQAEAAAEAANNAGTVETTPSQAAGQKRPAGGESPARQAAGGAGAGGEKKPKRRRKTLHDLSDISSVGITTHGQLDEYRFNMFMRDLLTEKAKDIFRCKGVLCVHGYGSKKFVFQGVHETICYGPAEHPWRDGEPRLNQIVFIGRGLDRRMLIDGFRTCVWRPLPHGWQEATDDTTKRPYYWNKATGEKSWARPSGTEQPPLLTSHQTPTQQPHGVAPSRMRTAGSISGAEQVPGGPNANVTSSSGQQEGGAANKTVAVA